MRILSSALLMTLLMSSLPALCKTESTTQEDKKHKLIDQIIDTVKKEKPTEEERQEFKKKREARFDHFIDVMAEKTKMSDEEKAKLKERIAKRRESHKSMPPELKEKLGQKLDWKNFCQETTYQVLGDHLTDNDLKALLKFIKSPTGRKIVKQAPDMISQAVALAAEKYVPLIVEKIKEFKPGNGFLPPGTVPGPDNQKRKEMLDRIQQFLRNPRMDQQQGPGKDET